MATAAPAGSASTAAFPSTAVPQRRHQAALRPCARSATAPAGPPAAPRSALRRDVPRRRLSVASTAPPRSRRRTAARARGGGFAPRKRARAARPPDAAPSETCKDKIFLAQGVLPGRAMRQARRAKLPGLRASSAKKRACARKAACATERRSSAAASADHRGCAPRAGRARRSSKKHSSVSFTVRKAISSQGISSSVNSRASMVSWPGSNRSLSSRAR